MTFDLVPIGEDINAQKAAQAVYAKLPPQVREKMMNAKLAFAATGGRSATKLTYKMWSDGCHDVGIGQATCNIPGATVSGVFLFENHTPSGFTSTLDHTLSPWSVIFNPMNPSLQISVLESANVSLLYPKLDVGECVPQVGPPNTLRPYASTGLGGLYVNIEPERDPICSSRNASAWANSCVPATPCFRATDTAQRHECTVNPGKFAVIPFEGTQVHQNPHFNLYTNTTVSHDISWKICCGCGQAPPPPDVPKKSCQDPTMVNFDIEKNRKMRDIKTEQMKTLSKSYQDAMNKALSHLQQFNTTARMCLIQAGAKDALLTALAMFAPGGEAAIAAEAPAEAAEISEAVEGLLPQMKDPAGTIFNIISSLENNEDPTPKMIPFEKYQQFLEALEVAKAISVQINGDLVTKAEAQLDGCVGTIGLSTENWQGANHYVEDLKEGMAILPEIQSLTNDIRDLDAEYEDLQFQAYAACVKNAACLNQPASSCDKLKPAGNWAKPQ
jgi:hypothetical protein